MNAQQLTYPDSYFDVIIAHLILAIVPEPIEAAKEAARVLKNKGRLVVFDKFLPDHAEPSVTRKALNIMTNILATDINRKLGDIIKSARLEVIEERSTMRGGNFKIVLLRKKRSELQTSEKNH